MNEKITKILYIFILSIVLILQFSLSTFANTDDEKCAWGFTRGKNHEQPNLDSKSLKVLENHNRYRHGK